MAERFLSWKLPENFNPDGGISFQKVGNEGTTYEFKREPSGTNLLDFTQAAAMVRHMLGDVPATALVPSAWRGKSASGELKFTQLPRVAEVWGEQGLEVIPLYA